MTKNKNLIIALNIMNCIAAVEKTASKCLDTTKREEKEFNKTQKKLQKIRKSFRPKKVDTTIYY
jgi:hypothetical protein